MNKKILLILACIIVIAVAVAGVIYYKSYFGDKKDLTDDKSGVLIKVQYLDDGTVSMEKKDDGYIIYKSGLIEKYDNIKETKENMKKISQDDLNNILKLVDEIDESKVMTMYTVDAVDSGNIILVYNSSGKEVMIENFYSDNYSDAARQIYNILDDNDLIHNNRLENNL